MTTFSQMIRKLANELVRPDMVNVLPSYLNQTIRELHTNAQTSMPVLYADNRVEFGIYIDSLTDQTGAFVWDMPKIPLLQQVEAVFYNSIRRYVPMKSPAVARQISYTDPNREYYWYRIGGTLVFSKPGAIGDSIDISYFMFPRALKYYPTSPPAVYDEETMQYSTRPDLSPDDAMALSTNWLIARHEEALLEGVRAKAYKRMADEIRSRTCYSQFEAMRIAVQTNESMPMQAIYSN